MKNKIAVTVILGFISVATGSAASTQISYISTDLGSGRWQCTYEVANLSLPVPIEEFTIWFDYGLYENLTITTPDPPANGWSEIVWQPEIGLGDGGYDAMTLGLGIGDGESVDGFSVSFDWLGDGVPDSQFYETINPSDFSTIDSGYTVPEPSTIVLFALGGLCTLSKKKSKLQ